MTVLPMPALESVIIHVKTIVQVEVGDKIRTTVDGETVGYPPRIVPSLDVQRLESRDVSARERTR